MTQAETITGKEILPGYGLQQLRFGTARSELRNLLGEPSEIDRYSDEEDFAAETWHYDELELSLVVEEMEDWRVTTITVSSDDYQLLGEKPIGWEKQKLLDWLAGVDLGKFELENWSDDEFEDFLLVSLPEQNVNCWLVAGEVSEIQWGVAYDENDEAVWPDELP